MSQPYRRGARVPVPGTIDKELGEFWSDNPWDIASQGHNLSCYERNRAYLNVAKGKDRNFLEISHITGTDSDGDGRSAVAADFRNNGQLDLIVRQVGGGAVLLYENRFPKRHFLKVSLRGTPRPGVVPTSNRPGIGSRLIAYVGDQRIFRDMIPVNSYKSQGPNIVHFGLGDATKVDKLVIRWPSGKEQILTDVAGDRHIVVDEEKDSPDAIVEIVPGKTMKP